MIRQYVYKPTRCTKFLCWDFIFSIHKNFVHLVGLYTRTYCKTMHGSCSVKYDQTYFVHEHLLVRFIRTTKHVPLFTLHKEVSFTRIWSCVIVTSHVHTHAVFRSEYQRLHTFYVRQKIKQPQYLPTEYSPTKGQTVLIVSLSWRILCRKQSTSVNRKNTPPRVWRHYW